MSKNRKMPPGQGFWKGTCCQCGTPITRRTSLGIPVLKQVGRLKRQCRDGCPKKQDNDEPTL